MPLFVYRCNVFIPFLRKLFLQRHSPCIISSSLLECMKENNHYDKVVFWFTVREGVCPVMLIFPTETARICESCSQPGWWWITPPSLFLPRGRNLGTVIALRGVETFTSNVITALSRYPNLPSSLPPLPPRVFSPFSLSFFALLQTDALNTNQSLKYLFCSNKRPPHYANTSETGPALPGRPTDINWKALPRHVGPRRTGEEIKSDFTEANRICVAKC